MLIFSIRKTWQETRVMCICDVCESVCVCACKYICVYGGV